MNRTFINLLICFTLICKHSLAQTIQNDVFWNTIDSTSIYSQGGGIFKFIDPETKEMAYFWYGSHFKEAELYRSDPSITYDRNTIKGVSCYKSTDLVNWKDMGIVLAEDAIKGNRPWAGWFARMGVAYIEQTKQYALLSQHNNSVMVALADNPTGPFSVHKHIDMTSYIGTPNTGDQTVFTDEDTGKDYLIYSYGKGRHKGYVSEIGVMDDGTIGLLNCVEVFKGESREGNCMFKYNGKYYLCASNIYGWDSSYAYYLVSDNIYGPYEPVNDMLVMDGCEKDYAHVTQTGFFVNVKGTKRETVVYCGDRWCDFAGNGHGYNQWFPISFNGDRPYFNSLSEWTLDATTGEWTVGKNNNYVLNCSFEADRRQLPIPVKPRQEFMLGWDTKVIKGNKVSLDNPQTPHLNYMNTKEDRMIVIGEKSLCISDCIDFEREVSQSIISSPFVSLPDGEYILKFMFRDNGKFNALTATITSEGGTYKLNMRKQKSNDKWTGSSMKVHIKGGKASLSFHAKGKANAQCLIDDVALTRTND